MKKYLAFDIGGTRIKWGILNEKGAILEKSSFDTSTESEELFLENIIKIALERKDEVEGVALSMPGFIDSPTYACSNSNTHKIRTFSSISIKLFC